MKKLLMTLAALSLMTGVAFGQANEIGIYTTQDANPDNASYDGVAGQITAYVVCSAPVNDTTGGMIETIGGFEFRLVIPASAFLLAATLPPLTTNFAASPDFLCGSNIPVVDGHATLLTLNIGAFSVVPGPVYLTPVLNAPQSVPGSMAITDYDDDFRISTAFPSSGDFELPVFGLWTSVVPTEDAAWGDVKSLFR